MIYLTMFAVVFPLAGAAHIFASMIRSNDSPVVDRLLNVILLTLDLYVALWNATILVRQLAERIAQ